MIKVSHSNELVQCLSSRIAGEDHRWFIDVAELLEKQSDEALADLLEMAEDFNALCWGSVSHTLQAFIHGGGGVPDNTHLVEDSVPHEEFALKVAFLLTPLAVKHHESFIGMARRYLEVGRAFDLDDMHESVTGDVYRMLSELLPQESSLEMARACYLITLFGRRHAAPFPRADDLSWMTEHALEIIPIADSVFDNGVFDRGLAEQLLTTEVPLREGVL